MKHSCVIDYVDSHCYLDNGNKLHNGLYSGNWWESRNALDIRTYIKNYTAFLPKSSRWAARIWHVKHKLQHIPVCKSCNKEVNFNYIYRDYCSVKCSNTSKIEQIKATCLAKYGVENPSQVPEIKKKIKNTCLAKYGVENPMQVNAHVVKFKESCANRYGTEHYSQIHIPKDSLDKSLNKLWLLDKINKGCTPTDISEMLSISVSVIHSRLRKFNIRIPLNVKSSMECDVANFVISHKIDIVQSDRTIISPLEIDIYLPIYKLAIECNGSYWHSEKKGKDKDYHLYKTKLCKKKGIHLIHIWEHDWNNKRLLIESRLRSKFGLNEKIYARKTTMSQVDSALSFAFLNKNHIQGNCQASVRYGLYYDTELVALMTFGKSRYKKDIEWELIRYCSKQGINVVGGASKLFKQFVNAHDPKLVISYSDKMWNTGNLYKYLGFEYSHTSVPAYRYTKDYILFENRIVYQKHKLKDKLEIFDPMLTEWENMQANGYDRIWDCGNDVWLNTLE